MTAITGIVQATVRYPSEAAAQSDTVTIRLQHNTTGGVKLVNPRQPTQPPGHPPPTPPIR